jgi:hypothetical protein
MDQYLRKSTNKGFVAVHTGDELKTLSARLQECVTELLTYFFQSFQAICHERWTGHF